VFSKKSQVRDDAQVEGETEVVPLWLAVSAPPTATVWVVMIFTLEIVVAFAGVATRPVRARAAAAAIAISFLDI
jgi:hypothetical protein